MGLGSFLKKFALPIGAMVAAPFTAGTSLAGLGSILGTAGKIGSAVAPVLGGMAGARGKSQQAAEAAQFERDRLALQGKEFALRAPGTRLSTGLRASLMANAQPARASTLLPGTAHPRASVVRYGGGLTPEAIGPDARTLAQNVLRQQLMANLKGDEWTPTPAPKPGKLDKILGIGSGIASILGAVGPLVGGKKAAPYAGNLYE